MDFFERIGAVGRRIVPELAGRDEPTFVCHWCSDIGLITTGTDRHSPHGRHDTSWYCRCDRGQAMETGHWFDKVYPEHGNRRTVSIDGQKQFEDYLHSNPDRFWLRAGLERLRKNYEQARSRKLAEMER